MEIPLNIDAELNSFKLLELPPGILASLQSDRPTVLELKSETFQSSSASHSAPTTVLCTEDQTFELRQVQSSNILHILRPTDGDAGTSLGLSAIAECRDLLEVVQKNVDIIPYLRTKLPLYTNSGNAAIAVRTQDLFADAPFSDKEIHNGLVALCVFEEEGCSWIPSAGVLKSTWTSLINSTAIEGAAIEQGFDFDRIKSLVLEDGCHTAIFDAVVRRISSKDEEIELSVSSSKCIPWVGVILLEATEAPVPIPDFLEQWRDLLPEAWRTDADLNLIQDNYVELENQMIRFKHYEEQGVTLTATSKPLNTSKSKWHDRFKTGR